MFILVILLFIFVSCMSVYFYFLLVEKNKEIDELYDLIYKHINEDMKKEFNKSKVIKIC